MTRAVIIMSLWALTSCAALTTPKQTGLTYDPATGTIVSLAATPPPEHPRAFTPDAAALAEIQTIVQGVCDQKQAAVKDYYTDLFWRAFGVDLYPATEGKP